MKLANAKKRVPTVAQFGETDDVYGLTPSPRIERTPPTRPTTDAGGGMTALRPAPSADNLDDLQVQPQRNVSPDQLPPILAQPIPAGSPTVREYQPTPEEQDAEMLRQAERKYADAVTQPAEKQKLWKQLLYGGLQVLSAVTTGRPNASGQFELLGNAKKRVGVEQAGQELGALQQQRDIQQQAALRDAQIADIPIDNALKQQQININRQNQLDRNRQTALGQVTKLKYYDPKNPAHRELAQNAGLDPNELEGWDDRNPVTKTVAGVTYQYNRTTGKFEPSNLPTDESATLTDYTVTMPTGEKRTYKVAQKDAARFAMQMQMLGMQVESREREGEKNRQFQARQQQIRIEAQQTLEQLKTTNDLLLKAVDAAERERLTKLKDEQTQRYIQLRNEARESEIRLRDSLDDN